MIESLTLRNFQAHEKLKITFSPFVTVIAGPSDVGKSSVVRALKWLVSNKPSGEAFIRDGAEETKVTLEVDGHTINRNKGKGNSYWIDGEKLVAFKTDVPEDVANLLNVSMDVNFQDQHDAPFWFSDSAGDVSRALNSIVDLGSIDTTLGNLQSKLREVRGEITVAQHRLEVAEKAQKEGRIALEMDQRLKVVEGLALKASQTSARRSQIDDLVKDAILHGEAKDRAANQVVCLEQLVGLAGDWFQVKQQRMVLQQKLESISRLEVLVKVCVPDITGLEKQFAAWQASKQKRIVLQNLVGIARNMMDEHGALTKESTRLHGIFEKELEGKPCPLCNQTIVKNHV